LLFGRNLKGYTAFFSIYTLFDCTPMKHEEIVDNLVDLFTTRFDEIENDVLILRQLLIAKGVIREDI
jgi:hypothetical protein